MDESKQIEFQIQQLTELQHICNRIKELENYKQNDTELLKCLKKEYSLSEEEISSITSMVEGKKGKSVDKRNDELELLEKKFEPYCLICGVNTKNKDGNFIGYTRVSNKCSNKKSVLKKKIKKMEEKGE
ncbi:hypothetical protein [uncultured Desulfobacter sp.]|uniref:hypothetical protein n=1 Tax=uncultured Desulfobacter sp. TaxID=240139 RepID=UPI0029C6A8D6|nr:hypothetical protein [uncultured Desulfobacter sp.]